MIKLVFKEDFLPKYSYYQALAWEGWTYNTKNLLSDRATQKYNTAPGCPGEHRYCVELWRCRETGAASLISHTRSRSSTSF